MPPMQPSQSDDALRLFHAAEAFDRWFDGSRIVDSSGRPLVVYRADRKDVDRFDRSKRRETGIFFALEPERAVFYGKPNAYLVHATNPLDLRDAYSAWRKDPVAKKIIETLYSDHYEGEHSNETGEPYDLADVIEAITHGYLWKMDGLGGWNMRAWRELQDMTEAYGYDGLIVHDDGEGVGAGLDVVVFEDRQARRLDSFEAASSLVPASAQSLSAPLSRESIQEEPAAMANAFFGYPSAFQTWFEGSLATDYRGLPVRLYHGTNQAFDAFDQGMRGASTASASSRLGFWFTDSPDVAFEYANKASRHLIVNVVTHEARTATLLKSLDQAQNRGHWDLADKLTNELESHDLSAIQADSAGQNIIPVHLAMKNPLEVLAGQWDHSTGKGVEILEYARAQGHDGVIFRNCTDCDSRSESDHYVVFDPGQIASVISSPLLHVQRAAAQAQASPQPDTDEVIERSLLALVHLASLQTPRYAPRA